MVYRNKDFTSPPPALIDAKWSVLKADLLITKGAHEINDKCYRDATIDALALLYKNKCAICERLRGTELQVDHYRPKKARNNKLKIHYNNPGYYWLTYTWSNLIPLCSKCNGKKSNKFPLRGWTHTNRVSDHNNVNGLNPFLPNDLNWLQNQELPLMVNPELDKTPERHFVFHSSGKIVGRTDEGIETIKICKLNRSNLVRDRLKIINDHVDAIKSAFVDFSTHNDPNIMKGELIATFKKMKLNCHKDAGHSYFNLFIFKYYNHFIDLKLPLNLRGVSTKYFREYNN